MIDAITNASGPDKQQYNNLDLHRILRHFPAWSSAYKLYYQNAAKLLGPLMQGISTKTNLVDAILEGTYHKYIPFEYSRQQFNYKSSIVPSTLQTQNGEYKYVGDIGDSNPQMFAYKSAIKFDISAPVMFRYSGTNYDTIKLLNRDHKIYIYVPSSFVGKTQTVSILGSDKHGNILKEQITFNSESIKEQINYYRYIIRIHSDEEFVATTTLNLDIANGENQVGSIQGFQKRIADMHGNFFDPKFYTEGKDLFIYNSSSGAREDNWRMKLEIPDEEQITKFFITTYFDIIVLTNAGNLYGGKLMLDNYNNAARYESTNNNEVIEIDYDINNEIQAQINADFVKDIYGASRARIEVLNNGTVAYVKNNGDFTLDSDTWLDLQQVFGKTRLFFDRDNQNEYEIRIRLDSTPEVFCAITTLNRIKMNLLTQDCADLIYQNRQLQTVDAGRYNGLQFFRKVFLSTSSGLLFSEQVTIEDV